MDARSTAKLYELGQKAFWGIKTIAKLRTYNYWILFRLIQKKKIKAQKWFKVQIINPYCSCL